MKIACIEKYYSSNLRFLKKKEILLNCMIQVLI